MRTLDSLKLSSRETGIKIAAHLAIGDLSHAAAECVADKRTLIDDGLPLEVLIARKRQGFTRPSIELTGVCLMLNRSRAARTTASAWFPNSAASLRCAAITSASNESPSVARGVRSDLGRLLPNAASALQIRANLLAPRARCVEIFLRVALDLRRSASANGDLVTKLAKPVSQLGLIDGSGELLRSEKTLRLDGPGLAVCAFRHIKDDRMGMELRSDVAIDRPGGVVLEFGGNELRRGLRRMVPTNACLRVSVQAVQAPALTLSRWASRTRISPPTSAVSETDLGAEKVASHPARCSIVFTIFPSAPLYT